VGGHLFVARRDEPDAALAERVEKCDDRVSAQAENHVDAEALQILGEQIEAIRVSAPSRFARWCGALLCSYGHPTFG
jgi:predicted ATPase